MCYTNIFIRIKIVNTIFSRLSLYKLGGAIYILIMLLFRKQTLVALLYAFISCIICNAQNIDSLLVLQQQVDPQEKMFVHFDKNYYNPGETIWFKAYLFTGLTRSQVSKNLYAELRDEKGVLIDKKTAPVVFSGAASHFTLPDSFPKTKVVFRAYTTAMLNGDTDFIYVKPLRIINQSKRTASTKPIAVAPQVRFLPEGGEWITGLPAVMAFITTGTNEMPVNSRGFIKGSDGKQVVMFESLHDGMGSFNITPQAGQTYTAVWKDDKGKEFTTQLPKPKDNGIALQVTDAEGGKKFTVERQAHAGEDLQTLTVIGVLNEQLAYQAKLNLTTKSNVSAVIPVNDLPSGILAITVFDKHMRPVTERITFINNNNYEFDADAWISDLNIGKRALNRAEVKISDTVSANVSISITDADIDVPANEQDNIVTRMLLTGDLRGKINNPYYYFFSTADSTSYYLDLVMLTHGWRRYQWDNVLSGKVPPATYRESNYLALSGKLVNAQGGSFEPNLMLNGFMKTMDSASTFVVFPVERTGNVLSDGLIFYDSVKLYLQFNDKQKDFEPSMLNLNNGLLQNIPTEGLSSLQKNAPYEPDSSIMAKNAKINSEELKMAAKKYKDAHELQNVTVTARAKTNIDVLDQKYASAMFSGDAKQFDIINDPSAQGSLSIFQYLQGKVAGLQITTSGANTSLSWRGSTPVLYLDEMQANVSTIQTLSMSNVAYVKVFNPSSAGVISNSGGGVISIYTRKGGDVAQTTDSKLGLVKLTGYSPIKEFYSPDYASATTDTYYDDLRTTLYWNPFVILDKTKKRFKFQFYNNDISTRFRIVMEGINEDGKLVHVEKVMTKN
jgi:hypothetical protein